MLYNKDWDKKPAIANPCSLEGLIAWLQTKHPREQYNFHDADKCLLGQYARHLDVAAIPCAIGGNSFTYAIHGEACDLSCFSHIAHGNVDMFSRTFGQALKRAEHQLFLKGSR